MVDLQEIEAIKRLKYKYLRCLDLKQWAEMETCFTTDATAAYGDGKYSFAGRDPIMQFLRQALGGRAIISAHRVQQPESRFLREPKSAKGAENSLLRAVLLASIRVH